MAVESSWKGDDGTGRGEGGADDGAEDGGTDARLGESKMSETVAEGEGTGKKSETIGRGMGWAE